MAEQPPQPFQQFMRQAHVVTLRFEQATGRVLLESNVSTPDEMMRTLCEGLVMVLRIGRKHGDGPPDTQKKLDRIKSIVWNGIINKYDDPDVRAIFPEQGPPPGQPGTNLGKDDFGRML